MLSVVVVVVLLSGCAGEPSDDEAFTSSALAVTTIPRGSTWRYWDQGGDLGTAWRAASFNDSAWPSGAGPLGYGETYQRTTLSYGPSASSKHINGYFRRTFVVSDPTVVTALGAELMYDDGLVIYLNGVEVQRRYLPATTITASTLATNHETGDRYDLEDWTASRGLLVAGTNTIAVEVHQSAPSSSDLTFDLALLLETSEAPPPPEQHAGGVPRNAQWAYWDNGGDLGTAWRSQPPGGAGWDLGAGPLGYGESYLGTTVSYGPSSTSKYITTYFTTSFWLDDPSTVSAMSGEVMYDDGFVVYLNGVELHRDRLPLSGTITATTLASGHEASNAYATYTWTDKRGALRAGANIVAVEVHQADPSSSDLVFDLAFQVSEDGPPPPPPPPPPSEAEDIARGSAWRYWDGAAAPSPDDAWATPGYADVGWASGAGPLGYGESYVRTPISYGSDPASKPITAYFRRWFTVESPSSATRIMAELLFDDGVVVHLNGHEIARLYMPAGTVGHTTLSTGHETGQYEPFDWSAHSSLLVPGANLIAVEVHQLAPSSSDLTFDLAVSVAAPVGDPSGSPVLVGAGDIAPCGGAEAATAALLDGIAGTVFTAGDNAYPDGTLADYQRCFEPTWGRHKARMKPTPGNHEYAAGSNAAGYFAYFGAAAGRPGEGYYGYDVGAWHVIVLNSNLSCAYVPCRAGSAQEQWLRAELAAHPTACTLAIVHHPRFSSGSHGDQLYMRDLWRTLHEHGADVVVSGHDHLYERFAPQDPDGNPDPTGLRQFIVGTGGTSFHAVTRTAPNSEVRNSGTHGVLRLTLHADRYDWQFVPVAGQTFTDSGTASCH